MKETIQAILARVVPNAFVIVKQYENKFSRTQEIAISISATDDLINGVRGQYPAHVSLCLCLDSMTLAAQVFGGNGGQHIYREPNREDPKEKHLALKSVKIPFRKPQQNEAAVLKAIEKFAVNWREILKENLGRMPKGYNFDFEKATRI